LTKNAIKTHRLLMKQTLKPQH